MRQLPSLNALRAFEAAARHASFSRAAEELFVTPAAVSQQVRHLETELGVPLFSREKRRIALSEAGETLLPGIAAGLDSLASAVARVRRRGNDRGVQVSVSPTFASGWLIPRLDDFRVHHPDVAVRIDATMALARFDDDGVDLAIRFGAGKYPGLKVDRLSGAEEVFPVSAPALLEGPHPLDEPGDLAHHLLLHDGTRDLGGIMPDWAMWLRAAGVEGVDPNYGMTLMPYPMVISAAIDGQGVALGRGRAVAADLAAGRLVRPFPLALPLAFSNWLVYPPGGLARRPVVTFRDWLLAETAELRD